jgi:hypothetical protein
VLRRTVKLTREPLEIGELLREEIVAVRDAAGILDGWLSLGPDRRIRTRRTVVAELRAPCQLASGSLPRGSGLDLDSDFVRRFGDLVALMRVDPGNDAAQALALTAAASAVASTAVEVDASSDRSGSPEGVGLRARMLARQVDRLRVAAGAEPHELAAVARALAHDLTPIPATPHVQVERMRLLAPPSR